MALGLSSQPAWQVGLLAAIGGQLAVESCKSLRPECVERRYGTNLYYHIKFYIGCSPICKRY